MNGNTCKKLQVVECLICENEDVVENDLGAMMEKLHQLIFVLKILDMKVELLGKLMKRF